VQGCSLTEEDGLLIFLPGRRLSIMHKKNTFRLSITFFRLTGKTKNFPDLSVWMHLYSLLFAIFAALQRI